MSLRLASCLAALAMLGAACAAPPRGAGAETACPRGSTLSGDDCGAVQFEQATRVSCALARISCGDAVDLEGWQTFPCSADGACEWFVAPYCRAEACIPGTEVTLRVLGMNRWRNGRILAYCDGTTLVELLERRSIARYLAPHTSTPRIATIGSGWPCEATGTLGGVPGATPLSVSELEAYAAEPARLSDAYDVLVVCEDPWTLASDAVSPLSAHFVRDAGRSLVVTADYLLSSPERAAAIDQLVAPAGFRFVPMQAPDATLRVDETCAPGF